MQPMIVCPWCYQLTPGAWIVDDEMIRDWEETCVHCGCDHRVSVLRVVHEIPHPVPIS